MTSPKPMIPQHQLSLPQRSLPPRFQLVITSRTIASLPKVCPSLSIDGWNDRNERSHDLAHPPCPPIPSHYPRFVCQCMENMP